jgi:hypothetical protein
MARLKPCPFEGLGCGWGLGRFGLVEVEKGLVYGLPTHASGVKA